MQSRLPIPLSQENPLWISWHDTTWIPILNPTNVMDYFQEKSNPFYDRTCNNEIIKMQRVGIDQMLNMTGREYILLHVQEPILYVIRKQHRHSPTEFTPMADYYIIAGTVYQAPDLASVFNSRLLSITQHLQAGFEEASTYSRYHPNKGYSWDFSSNKALTDKTKTQKRDHDKSKEEPSSFFQRKRIDMLLGELLNKFPLPLPPQHQPQPTQATSTTTAGASAPAVSSQQPQSAQQQQLNGAPQSMAKTAAKLESHQDAGHGDDSSTAGIEIKQELMDASSPMPSAGNGSMMDTGDLLSGSGGIKMEPNDMKPPPEKKMKM